MGRNRLIELERRLDEVEQSNSLFTRTDPSIALGIDLVDLGNSVVVSVRDSTGGQSINTGAWRQINLNVIDIDTSGDGVDLGNSKIVVRRTGIYLILYGVRFVSSPNTTAKFAGYSINSTNSVAYSVGPVQVQTDSEIVRIASSHINTLTVGDSIRLMAFVRTTLNTEAGEGMPYLSIHLLGTL